MAPQQRGGDALRIGVDLGGTKIEFVALDAKGSELHREPRCGSLPRWVTCLLCSVIHKIMETLDEWEFRRVDLLTRLAAVEKSGAIHFGEFDLFA